MTRTPRLPRERIPGYLDTHWRGKDPRPWVNTVAAGVLREPVALPLTRLSGSLVYPVLERAEVDAPGDARLKIALVSVSPPTRALRELLQLRAYGHSFVLLPPTYRQRFFEVAELDFRGIGVSAACADGSVESVVSAAGVPDGLALEPWWRTTREAQLRALAQT